MEYDLIITNARIVDVKDGVVLPRKTIVIKNDTIHTVTDDKKAADFKAVQFIDASDKYVIPGLWDMHTHVLDDTLEYPYFNRMLVANGVTGIRDMWGSDLVAAWAKKQFTQGKLPHQHFYRTNHIADGPPGSSDLPTIDTPEEAVHFVDSIYENTTADFIKTYSLLRPDVYYAIAKRCNELKFPFAGHVPDMVPVENAIKIGHKCIDHMEGIDVALSTEREELYKQLGTLEIDWTKRIQRINDTQSDERIPYLADLLLKHGAMVSPTFVVLKGTTRLIDGESLDSGYQNSFIPSRMKKLWRDNARYLPNGYAEPWKKFVARQYDILRLLSKEGVLVLAGSDTSESLAYTYAGFSLHEELEELVKAGLSPLQALQAATLNAGIFLNRPEKIGQVSPGFYADLVILEGNPLDNISQTRKIHSVISKGIYYDRTNLNNYLDEARRLIHQRDSMVTRN